MSPTWQANMATTSLMRVGNSADSRGSTIERLCVRGAPINTLVRPRHGSLDDASPQPSAAHEMALGARDPALPSAQGLGHQPM
jgi:hypothetical protein